jgi:hypothetical protein
MIYHTSNTMCATSGTETAYSSIISLKVALNTIALTLMWVDYDL